MPARSSTGSIPHDFRRRPLGAVRTSRSGERPAGCRASAGSPVDPLIRRIGELDLLLVEIPLVTVAYEIDPERLVLRSRLAAALGGDLHVTIREAPHVDAEAVRLRIPTIPAGHAEDGVIHGWLGAGRDHTDHI